MNDAPKSITIRKTSASQMVSREILDSYDKPYIETAEQRGDRIARNNHQWDLYEAAIPALAAITDPVSRAILELHAADADCHCRGCDYAGYDAEPVEWPCRTTQGVAALHAIELPDSVPTYRETIGPDPEPVSFRAAMDDVMSRMLDAFKPEETA